VLSPASQSTQKGGEGATQKTPGQFIPTREVRIIRSSRGSQVVTKWCLDTHTDTRKLQIAAEVELSGCAISVHNPERHALGQV